ncbi:15522_t:CDS:2, partial [Rhizophagus irregularis]
TGRYSPTSRRRTRSKSNLSSHYSGQYCTSFHLDPQVYELQMVDRQDS